MMARSTIDRLIVNSPYEEPAQHWRYDRKTRLFDLVPGRRSAGYVVASEDSRAFDDPGALPSTVRTSGRRLYSGVPKADAPVRMSTFEVNDPMVQGTPGFTHWSSTMAVSPSATNCVTAPASVTGAIAPARVKGVTMTGCPRRAR